MKKFISSLTVACVLALSLSTGAFAASNVYLSPAYEKIAKSFMQSAKAMKSDEKYADDSDYYDYLGTLETQLKAYKAKNAKNSSKKNLATRLLSDIATLKAQYAPDETGDESDDVSGMIWTPGSGAASTTPKPKPAPPIKADAASTGGGTGSKPPAPVISISASPMSVAANATTNLTWTSANADSCQRSGVLGNYGATETSGTNVVTKPLTKTTTFNLKCTGAGGTTTSSVTVTVAGNGTDSSTAMNCGNLKPVDLDVQYYYDHPGQSLKNTTMKAGEAYILSFTTGSTPSGIRDVAVGEYGGAMIERYFRFSKNRCDFSVPAGYNQQTPAIKHQHFTVGTPYEYAGNYPEWVYPTLEANTKYYLNLKAEDVVWAPGIDSCKSNFSNNPGQADVAGSCGFVMTFY